MKPKRKPTGLSTKQMLEWAKKSKGRLKILQQAVTARENLQPKSKPLKNKYKNPEFWFRYASYGSI